MQDGLEVPIVCAALQATIKAALPLSQHELFARLVAEAFPSCDMIHQVRSAA